jgi:hypothetical protein
VKRLDRAAVWRLLGEPSEQLGSVNEPRAVLEQGLSWNEKWIYPGLGGSPGRVVLWDRYDLVGIFRVDELGEFQPEPDLRGPEE